MAGNDSRIGTTGGTTQLDDGRVTMGSGSQTGTTAGYGSSSTGSTAAGGQGGARIVGGEESRGFHDGPGPQIMGSHSLEGNDVTNPQGDTLGEIKTIMLDVQQGRIAYAVLKAGGFLGMGEKLFAIPWSALTLDADNKCFILDATKEQLESAPGFDDSWPAMADPRFGSRVYAHYGQKPYWQTT